MANTYGLPEEMTAQAVFDKIALHLITQGRPSMELRDDGKWEDEAGCLYRDPNGLACAVGCLISDDDYVEGLEHQSAEALLAPSIFVSESIRELRLFPKPLRTGPIAEMIKDLQVVHDNAALRADGSFVIDKLRAHLRRTADRYELHSDAMFAIRDM